MIEIAEFDDYLQKMLSLPRPGAEKVLAFYEHRVGMICKDPRLMLIPLDDHIVHRGDGVFETLKYQHRRIYQLEAHIQRMKRGAEKIFLHPPVGWDRIGEIIVDIAKAGERDQGLVRFLLGRGPGGFGIDPEECPIPGLYVAAYEFKPRPEVRFEQGVTAFRVSVPAKQDWIAQIKSVNYLPNVLMKREAVEKGYDYPICFDERGFMAEGATENMALVDADGTLVVPEFTNAIAGTTIIRAIELIAEDTPVRFKAIAEDEIYNARELMVFGTSQDCLGIVRYNGKPIYDVRPGPLTKRIRSLLQDDLLKNGTPF